MVRPRRFPAVPAGENCQARLQGGAPVPRVVAYRCRAGGLAARTAPAHDGNVKRRSVERKVRKRPRAIAARIVNVPAIDETGSGARASFGLYP